MSYTKERPESVITLFDRIAPYYDKTNLALSMGLCTLWMRRLVKKLQGSDFLGDLCGGTGAVALGFLRKNRKATAVVYDFSEEMLAIAEKRLRRYGERGSIQCGDCHKLPYKEQHFSTLSMAYGLRNLKEPLSALKECRRVLQRGGKLYILELTRPKSALLYKMHQFYLKLFVPLIGKCMTKDREAYCYLAKTVAHFSPPEEIEKLLLEAGFSHIEKESLSFGIATLVTAER